MARWTTTLPRTYAPEGQARRPRSAARNPTVHDRSTYGAAQQPGSDLMAILAEAFRSVHGGACLREDVFHVVACVGERQPDADGHGVLVSVEVDRHREYGLDAFGQLHRISADVDWRAIGSGPGPRRRLDDDDEAVASNARGRVFGAQRGKQSRGGCLEHRVARLVAAVVVDSLEFVEVAGEHRELVAAAVGPGERVA